MTTDRIAEDLLFRHHRATDAQRHWCARAATPASVIRVFAPGTKPTLLRQLVLLPVGDLRDMRTQGEFERWFESQLHALAVHSRREIERISACNQVLKWGHAAKVLSLYLRSLVLHSRFFSDEVVDRVRPWLFVPVDSYVIKKLKKCGVSPPFSAIKEIATRRDFYFVQTLLADRCTAGVSRIVFDDSWADRGELLPGGR